MFGSFKRSLGDNHFQQVAGMVTDIQHGEHREEKSAGFGVEVLTIRCDRTSKPFSLARFSEDAGYGTVFKGDVVAIQYADVLDADDFGTVSKIMGAEIKRHALDL